MFTHYDDPDGCEWLRGGLDDFVAHYNNLNGTRYSLTACLDIVKSSGDSPKEPEVLVTDTDSGRKMVIERKSVVSPPNYLHRHQLGHQLADLIGKAVGDTFGDAEYVLSVRTRDFEELSGRQVAKAAEEIGQQLVPLNLRQLPAYGERPIRWSFGRRQFDYDGESRVGITVEESEEMNLLDDSGRDEALAQLPFQIQQPLIAAGEKFGRYSDCTRLVLLDFYGERLLEDDVPKAVSHVAIPTSVDEIWRTVQDWISHDQYQAGYDRLFLRPLPS